MDNQEYPIKRVSTITIELGKTLMLFIENTQMEEVFRTCVHAKYLRVFTEEKVKIFNENKKKTTKTRLPREQVVEIR